MKDPIHPTNYGPQHHPNDSPRNGTLHEIALKQLSQWEEMAWEWPCFQDSEGYMRCRDCGQSIARAWDDHGVVYELASDQILSLIVAHLRQRHSEVVHGND
jgi:hypothetical protein